MLTSAEIDWGAGFVSQVAFSAFATYPKRIALTDHP
jgi:hypothetical protein